VPDGTTNLGERLLRLREVEEKVGLKRSTIYRRIAAESFPPPIDLGPGTVRWRLSDVDAWIQSLTAAGR
jgi:prophage regulatory protein